MGLYFLFPCSATYSVSHSDTWFKLLPLKSCTGKPRAFVWKTIGRWLVRWEALVRQVLTSYSVLWCHRGIIKGVCCCEPWINLNCTWRGVDHVTAGGGPDVPCVLRHLHGPGPAVMQPQLLQGLSEALLGNVFTRVSGVQEKSHQVQSPHQPGSEKRLWGSAAGQEHAGGRGTGGEHQLCPPRGEVETVLSGRPAGDLCRVSVV